MELRSCVHLHFIQAVKGGLVTKVLNANHGRPTLSFKEVTDVYDSFMFCNDNGKAERSCTGAMEERTVKTEPDASVCNAYDVDDHGSCDLDDNEFDSVTLKQIKERCKTKKRKHSQGLDSSKRKINIEASSSLEDYRKKKMAADDSDFMETLSSWRSKLSKNMKNKKRRCMKDTGSTYYTQEIIPVVKSEEIQDDQEFSHSCGDSAALVIVKFEAPEIDCLDYLKKLSNVNDNSLACHRTDDYCDTREAEITRECILKNELNYKWKEHDDLIPLRMVWASSVDTVGSNSELTSDQSPNFPAIEFESEECIINPDLHCISPEVISLVEYHNSNICDNQPDGDTPVSLPSVATCRDDGTFLGECRKDEFTSGPEVQEKKSSTSESPESEEKQSFASIYDDTDELKSWNECRTSSNMFGPERLLSTRKAISPASQEKLCKAMQSIDIHDKNFLKCRGKLYWGEQNDKKNGNAEGLNEIMRDRFVDNPNRNSISPKTLERVFHPKGILKIPQPACTAPRLSTGCSSVHSCSKNAIAFSKWQMNEVECLAMKLTKELKSMKDFLDDMLRSEFCLNTSLRHKVNKARMAVKNATRAEATAKRCLSIMARDCSHFCKLMKLADDGPPAPENVVRKERKKTALADGRLCQVRFYEDDGASLFESNGRAMLL